VLTGPHVILGLKVAVGTVTVLLIAALIMLARGNYRWHGRINTVFFALTLTTVLGLEFLIRVVDPTLFDYFDEPARRMMRIHLSFSIPSAILLPVMLISGWSHRRRLHVTVGSLFLLCWTGTFVTGIFFLK
jgi:uncharacterized membrane protein YozB (DUF420 family)